MAATLEGLERDGLLRPAGAADAVDGVAAELVAEPASVQEASELLAAASRAGLRMAFAGGGGKLALGNPPERLDLLVSTRRLGRVLEHAAGDLVVKAEAGARLADLQAALEPAGQWLALDPPEPGATVGGVVAANASGPRRLRYGTVRDLIIGITVVLADGTMARAGGKVVKNVAGYDLAKLFCGSLGTLGLVAEATFRLHPRPAAAAVVALGVERPEQAGEAVRRLLRSTLEPSAIELTRAGPAEPGRLTVVFEGIRPGVEAQATNAARLLGEVADAEVLTIEGLGTIEDPHPLQQAFIDEHAAQCGYCIAGMVMSASALLSQNASPSDGEIREALAGNLCRCGTHASILRAVQRAAGEMSV